MTVVYLIGSLRNPAVPALGVRLRAAGYEVFDDWYGAGTEADSCWLEYEKGRGRSYGEALKGYAARQIFEFDKRHLDRADFGILVMPAGKSGHLELGYTIGRGKPGYVLFDEEPERWDVMYGFCNGVFFSVDDLIAGVPKPVPRASSGGQAPGGYRLGVIPTPPPTADPQRPIAAQYAG